MAPTSTITPSSIAMAFAGRTESVNIPKPRDNNPWVGKETYASVVAAKSLPTQKHTVGLPTPPNSLSPSLPPQAFKGHASPRPLTPPGPTHVDSDIDLEDAVEHAKAQDSPQRGLTTRSLSRLAESEDAVGNITPALLSKHHLPGVLLENGPLAIRHVMSYLTTSVPGFAAIPPARARRLVVAALEHRSSDGQQGGLDGNVMFEKVGWGRWDARRRGQPARETREPRQEALLQVSRTLQIPVSSTRQDRSRGVATSHDSEQDYDIHMEDTNVMEHEADKMSLGDTCSSTSPPSLKRIPDFDFDDVTEEEDWASIGAAALRQGSFPLSGGLMPRNQRYSPHHDPRSRRGGSGRPPAKMAKSMPSTKSIMYNRKTQQQQAAAHTLMGFSPLPNTDFGGDAEDRAAVEALLKLRSV